MDTIFKGDLQSRSGRLIAWVDALLVDHGVFRLGFANLAEVAPGRLYRTNHPTPGRLAKLVRRFGIQTLINLRGQAKNGSDALSRDAAARLGLDFVDMALESLGAPQRDRIRASARDLSDDAATRADPLQIRGGPGGAGSGFVHSV